MERRMESKPILAVKGISAPKVPHLTSPSKKYPSPATTIPKNSPITDESSQPSECLSTKPESGEQSEIVSGQPSEIVSGQQQQQQQSDFITTVTATNVSVTSTLTTTKTTKSSTLPSQSPTVGVVSPMMSHRVIKLPQTSTGMCFLISSINYIQKKKKKN
ncbi:unnamed protein product [Onchocerca flexuosa]|uniref:Flocculation protein FLO11-like n=1 Tax=Onchocerca flexuosa TaxID=387005 RepID=A0A183HUX9_9BILA|nr:unnamed protein product [Onchocerca flexuosa]